MYILLVIYFYLHNALLNKKKVIKTITYIWIVFLSPCSALRVPHESNLVVFCFSNSVVFCFSNSVWSYDHHYNLLRSTRQDI